MMLPLSGRNGYLKIDSSEIPIYSWNLSAQKARTEYRTAKSNVMPVRTSGLIRETLTINGVTHIPALLSDGLILGHFGWLSSPTERTYIPLRGRVTQVQYILSYYQGANPSFQWNAVITDFSTDESATQDKIFKTQAIPPFSDVILCSEKMCDHPINTTDYDAPDGLVKHVRTATLTYTRPTLDFVTAKSIPRFADGCKPPDRLVDLEIQGDFDYWYNKINYSGTNDLADDYKFNYDSSFLSMDKMRVLELSNLVVNVATSQMVSATVRLGASYS